MIRMVTAIGKTKGRQIDEVACHIRMRMILHGHTRIVRRWRLWLLCPVETETEGR